MINITEEFNLRLTIDKEKAMTDLKEVDDKRESIDKELDKTKEKSLNTYKLAVTMVSSAYSLLKNLYRASGVAIDKTTDAIITTVFQGLQILTPLATAQLQLGYINPAAAVAAALALSSLGVSAAMTIGLQGQQSAELEQLEIGLDSLQLINNYSSGSWFV